ncbi:hypothetical protein HPP92_002758 [Vanilla planifolia]|uniref:Uncharacterized protein n=1 Tax=Vanilla planifolia TaxID=51239 RepID=A0A835S2D1_VANPL|nr:hypothetical protein HPP92_002758 [Vanilla planifolia]
MELEDDVFYADLNKQISLLITEDDDDEENNGQKLPVRYPPAPVQVYAHFPQIMVPPTYYYELICKRESKGTGVFIPRSSFPRKKSSQTKQSHKASAVSHISTESCNHSNLNNNINKNNKGHKFGSLEKLNG